MGWATRAISYKRVYYCHFPFPATVELGYIGVIQIPRFVYTPGAERGTSLIVQFVHFMGLKVQG